MVHYFEYMGANIRLALCFYYLGFWGFWLFVGGTSMATGDLTHRSSIFSTSIMAELEQKYQ